MAAVTPASNFPVPFLLQNGRLLIVRFSAVSDGDTWASGISGIIDYIVAGQKNPSTQASAGADVTESGGTFTFYPGEDGGQMTLWILAR